MRGNMLGKVAGNMVRLIFFLAAAVVSADITPDAANMLLERGEGGKEVRIDNVFYSCVNGKDFAIVKNGKPENPAEHDAVEAGGLTIYVPMFMTFENNVPNIVVFPRRTGARDVGVSNVTS